MLKLEDHHRERLAYIYVRQSTIAQVRHNHESTERQYALKEKALAAMRTGMRTMIVPSRNLKDLEEVPRDVQSKINFVFVKTMDEIIKHALVSPSKIRIPKRTSQRRGAPKHGSATPAYSHSPKEAREKS